MIVILAILCFLVGFALLYKSDDTRRSQRDAQLILMDTNDPVRKQPDIEQSFWPQFHGPNRDNISAEKGLLKKWPDATPLYTKSPSKIVVGRGSQSD